MFNTLKAALVLSFILALISPAGAQNTCGRPSGSFDQAYCQKKVLIRADGDMNVVYALLLRKLDPAAQQLLRETQRAWLIRRDRDCVEGDASRGDGADTGCAEITTQRLNFLNDRVRECNVAGCQPNRVR